MRRLARQVLEVFEVPRDLVLGRYPPFVTGGGLPPGHVPVFVFHSLEPEDFTRKLQHLADNGYVTLSGSDYLDVLRERRKAPERAVVLTFDDGRGSLWSVGLPLLRRFGMKGIVFLVPGRTPSRAGALPPALDDAGAPAEAVLGREDSDGPFLSWPEVEAMAATGHFEFHSHTLTHARIHTRPDVAGFLHPRMQHGYAAMDVPLIAEDGRDLLAAEVPLGTPLLHAEPRTSEALRLFEDPVLRHPCVEAVAAEGAAFFQRHDWEARLRRVLPGGPIRGRIEAPAEHEAAIRHELAEAKRLIEAHTGRAAVHLCFPWHASGPTARRLAREVGYEAAFWGKVRGAPITLPGGDLQAIARIGEDYVELLPGRGRADLRSVLTRKWRRRMRAGGP